MGRSPSTLQTISTSPGINGKRITALKQGGLTAFIHSVILNRKQVKEPFYVLDLGVVSSLYNKWAHNLPAIQPFYAVKCNPDRTILGTLAALGSNFDCASQAEIEAVLSLGVSPDRIIFANPCKADSQIKYAESVGVNLTTFDSKDELEKIRKWHPNCGLLIRIKSPDDNKARRPLGSKYGALPTEIVPLLQAAQAANLDVVGVSFHIGSPATDSRAYRTAIAEARTVFVTAVSLGMPKMRVLDIGGGFVDNPQFQEAAKEVKAALETYFPNEPEMTLISEPGRFFVETASTLATNIIGKRVRGEMREYWINDGTYGSMNCIIRDALSAPLSCKPFAWTSNQTNMSCEGLKTYNSTVFGPTCDSLDEVFTDYQLPELQVNDWLVFPNMGAYTAAMGSSFNGFKTADILTYLVHTNTS
ncbi:ornithine decarboxylase-like [Melia azedarach]|nr:ornithine decarboxylase-like [Melia azedarach]